MELQKILEERYSVRSYKKEPLAPETVGQILEAGRLAPTGKNLQPWRVYVLESSQALEKIRSVCACTFGAPCVLLFCCDDGQAWHNPLDGEKPIGEMDVSIVCSLMMLKAWELGVGSCWVKYFSPAKAAKALNLPENLRPVCILDLGYPAEDAAPRASMHFSRKPMEELAVKL